MKSLFSQRKRNFSEEKKILVRDEPANLIVTLTTIMDSYECPEYRAGRYCARITQDSSKKTKYRVLRQVGQVLSPNG